MGFIHIKITNGSVLHKKKRNLHLEFKMKILLAKLHTGNFEKETRTEHNKISFSHLSN